MAGELEARQGSLIAVGIAILGVCGLLTIAFFYTKDKACKANCESVYTECVSRAKTMAVPDPEPGTMRTEQEFRDGETRRCQEVRKVCLSGCTLPSPGGAPQ
jgi:hypothetical protein